MGELGEKYLWTGPCIGGPLDAEETPGQSRFPKGFVYVDKPNNLAWIYDWSEAAGEFIARNDEPEALDKVKLRIARDTFTYDIRVAEEEVSHGYANHPNASRRR